MGMLDEKQLVADCPPFPLFDEIALYLERFGVTDSPQIADLPFGR
jgi:hypothetical protein